jgi:hypothetical protein
MAVMRADSLMCREMPVGHFDHVRACCYVVLLLCLILRSLLLHD